MGTAERRMSRLSDLYALTADMLGDETGDLTWTATSGTGGFAQIDREEGGLTLTFRRGEETTLCVHYQYPGEAGDTLQRSGFGMGETWTALYEDGPA